MLRNRGERPARGAFACPGGSPGKSLLPGPRQGGATPFSSKDSDPAFFSAGDRSPLPEARRAWPTACRTPTRASMAWRGA